MAFTVNDLLQIPFFQNVTVEAGQSGLSRPILATGIVDYEYLPGYEMPEQVFRKNDLLVSSLLFAKDRPDLLINTIRALAKIEPACLVYKTAFYEELPAEAVEIADRFGLPILRIGFDYYLEDILYQTNDHLRLENRLDERESLLRNLMENEHPKGSLTNHARLLLPNCGSYLCAAYIKMRKPQGYHFFENLYQKPMAADRGQRAILRYDNGLFWLASEPSGDEGMYRSRFNEDMAYMGLDLSETWVGLSPVGDLPQDLARTIRRAYYAAGTAQATGESRLSHSETGLYRFLAPLRDAPEVQDYAAEYLAPLFDKDNSRTRELYHTAVSYVRNSGDIPATAGELFCHKNTIRYRVSRLHELLDPDVPEPVFWERLSAAVKIRLLAE